MRSHLETLSQLCGIQEVRYKPFFARRGETLNARNRGKSAVYERLLTSTQMAFQ